MRCTGYAQGLSYGLSLHVMAEDQRASSIRPHGYGARARTARTACTVYCQGMDGMERHTVCTDMTEGGEFTL